MLKSLLFVEVKAASCYRVWEVIDICLQLFRTFDQFAFSGIRPKWAFLSLNKTLYPRIREVHMHYLMTTTRPLLFICRGYQIDIYQIYKNKITKMTKITQNPATCDILRSNNL